MLDVARVAERICLAQGTSASALLKRYGLADPDNLRWVALLAALHDLGKASPAFQLHPSFSPAELDVVRERLAKAGLWMPRVRDSDTPHGTITATVLPEILVDRYGFSPEAAEIFSRAAGAHHGVFATSKELDRVDSRAIGDRSWRDLRRTLVEELARIVDVPNRQPPMPDAAGAVAFSGLLAVADWIGSMKEYFRYAVLAGSEPGGLDLFTYAEQSTQRAEQAVNELGWMAQGSVSNATGFESLFPNIVANPLQKAAIAAASDLSDPALVIIEAPMGEGKTEAAMYLAQHFAARLGQEGCYFALPTQATSNQMFTRVREFLETARAGAVNLLLLHGHAALSAEMEVLRQRAAECFPSAIYGDAGAGQDRTDSSTVVTAQWFTYRKRGLLAPFGVGTVDQTLMAVLQTRHYFVRLFGLTGKTVIIDEVHAYDAYMTTLIERLLQWLGSLGASVVLLSATLPSARRDAFAQAYVSGLGADRSIGPSPPYPRLIWVSARSRGGRTITVSERSRRRIGLEWLDAQSVGERLASLLVDGGCAAVICNTVARAQEVYRSLKPLFPAVAEDGEPELMLFHARYPFEERDRREKLALVRFGKEGASVDFGDGIGRTVARPARAVIVATQVIEQSLDLDFDVMVSEFAPVDLILQRAGRLHRHQRTRSAGLRSARMFLIRPELSDGSVPRFGSGTEAVYDRHILLRSWLALEGRQYVDVPEDVEGLIEFVYAHDMACPDGTPKELSEAWAESWAKLVARRERYEQLARKNRITGPHDENVLEQDAGLEEDNPEVHSSLQALTRLSDGPEVAVILLKEDEVQALDLNRGPGREEAITLLRREVRITHRAVAPALLADQARRPPGWRRSPFLRYHRLLRLDTWGRETIGNFGVVNEPELGIVISRVTGEEEVDNEL
jgi:CRISPR-associated endonuclease/helicase Cas3